MYKKISLLGLVLNLLIILCIIIFYNNTLNIDSLWFCIALLWGTTLFKDNIKKSLLIIIYIIILVLNGWILFNIPKHTYKEACEIVLINELSYQKDNNVPKVMDNKQIKHLHAVPKKHNFMNYKEYVIVIGIAETQKVYLFDPFTGEYQKI